MTIFYYYINANKEKEGPHDLVTMMRRIRSGLISTSTLVYRDHEEPTSAHVIEELAHFFNTQSTDVRGELHETPKVSITNCLTIGWNFISENQPMMALAGFILAMSALFATLINEIAGLPAAIAAGWMMFMLLQTSVFVVSLRLYRGQMVNNNFLEKMLSPIVAKLLFVSLIFSLLIPITSIFLLIPAAFAMLLFAFASMQIFDYRNSPINGIGGAYKLIAKLDNDSKFKLVFLSFLYLISAILLFPIPLVLPIFAGAMASVYDELASS